MWHSTTVGSIYLAVTAATWVGASYITKLIVGSDGGTEGVPPWLLSLMCTACFLVYLPLLRIRAMCQRARNAGGGHSAPLLPQPPEVRLSSFTVLSAAILVMPFWLLAQYTFAQSLVYTSVTSNTVLSSTSGLFTFLASVLTLSERFTCLRFAGVLLTMGGTALIASADREPSDLGRRPLVGDVLTLVSAALYALYTTLMNRLLRHGNAEATAEFFGYMGVMSSVVLAPLLAWLWWTHPAGLVAQLTPTVLWLVLLQGMLDYVLADFTWARAVLLLGPTLASIGLSVQLPLAALADCFVGHPRWLSSPLAAGQFAAGTVAILFGIAGVSDFSSSRAAADREEGEGTAGGMAVGEAGQGQGLGWEEDVEAAGRTMGNGGAEGKPGRGLQSLVLANAGSAASLPYVDGAESFHSAESFKSALSSPSLL